MNAFKTLHLTLEEMKMNSLFGCQCLTFAKHLHCSQNYIAPNVFLIDPRLEFFHQITEQHLKSKHFLSTNEKQDEKKKEKKNMTNKINVMNKTNKRTRWEKQKKKRHDKQNYCDEQDQYNGQDKQE